MKARRQKDGMCDARKYYTTKTCMSGHQKTSANFALGPEKSNMQTHERKRPANCMCL